MKRIARILSLMLMISLLAAGIPFDLSGTGEACSTNGFCPRSDVVYYLREVLK